MTEPYTHCPGCACEAADLPAGDIVLIPVAVSLMRLMANGRWSGPVKIKIDQGQGKSKGLWELTVMTEDSPEYD